MKTDDSIPYGNINDTTDIGKYVRAQRKAQGSTQSDFAALCGVGVRFISELENGKSTMEMGKVLKVLKCLGLQINLQPRSWNKTG